MSDSDLQSRFGRPEFPAYKYLRKLQKENFAAVNEISRLELSTGVTAIYDPSQSDGDREKALEAQRKLKEVLELIAGMQHDHRPEGSEPAWGVLYYRDLLDAVSDSDRTVLQSVVLGLLYSHNANGWAIHHGSGDIIILDAVLKPLFEYLNNFTLLCIQRSVKGSQHLSGYWMAQSLLPHILYFTTGFPPSRMPWPRSPTEIGLMMIKTWTHYQLKFLIAHEMGHIALGHNGNNIERLAARPGLDHEQTSQIHHYNRSQAMEFEADEYATRLCFMHAEKRQDDVSSCRAAIELLFIYLSAIERTAEVLRTKCIQQNVMIAPIESHPQARDRLEVIRLIKPEIKLDGQNMATVRFTEDLFLRSWLTFIGSHNSEEIELVIQTLMEEP